jgi:Xaa-Pro aminopeptidase
MEPHFSSKFFASNRHKLVELSATDGPIIMTANGLIQRGGDTTFAFDQDASFWYLTGISEPDIVLVIDNGHEYLIVPSRSASREAFDGAVNLRQLSSSSGIKDIYTYNEGWHKLSLKLKKVKQAATLESPPAYVDSFGFYTNPARASLISSLKSHNPELELLDLAPQLVGLRTIKQPAEIKAIQVAINITNDTLKQALSQSKLEKYEYEYQLEAELSRGYRALGATGHSFEPIVASGQRGCTLHNVDNNGPLSKNELIVVDTGAEFKHYAADITRTIIVGQPSKRQQAVHKAVIEVQDYALDIIKPGLIMRDYEEQIERYMGDKLIQLGLIKLNTKENVSRYYPHATSHYLGLNVHDVADYSQPIIPGVVMTVEPGIYIKEEAIGVRIEDDVLINKDGLEVLSNKLPRGLKLD